MAKTAAEVTELLVAPTRAHCPEPVLAAMVCSHAGSMKSLLIGKFVGVGGITKTSDLPNPVLLAVGEEGVYAFEFKPRGFKMKVKKEVRRWVRSDVAIAVEGGTRMTAFSLCAPEGRYDFEATTMNRDGSNDVLDQFIDRVGRVPEEESI